MISEPTILVVGGPNGSGKSTVSPALLAEFPGVEELIDADAIARGISSLHPERVALTAGRVMLERFDELARSRTSFAFETTLSGKALARRLAEARGQGFLIELTFLALPDADLAVERVRRRVLAGGHAIPEPVIRRRFFRGLRNLFEVYMELADRWTVIENSAPNVRPVIAEGNRLVVGEVLLAEEWCRLKELAKR